MSFRFLEVDDDDEDEGLPKIENWGDYLKEAKELYLTRFNDTIKSNLKIEDFNLIRKIGKGHFSSLIIIERKINKKLYLLDVKKMSWLVMGKETRRILDHKRILQAIDFPFCTSLEFAFQDAKNLYLCMPLVNGGSLKCHLENCGKLGDKISKFISAQTVLALEYLHHLALVFRNLSPANVFLDHRGYIKLYGFECCKSLSSGRTFTFCGCPEYLAPEIILLRGHGPGVDWWAFGVLLYEMSVGKVPFVGDEEGKLYEHIIKGKYTMPVGLTRELESLVCTLLEPDLTKRCGSCLYTNPARYIKSHSWYADMDWLALLNYNLTSPYIPNITGSDDLSYFPAQPDDPIDKDDSGKLIRESSSTTEKPN